MLAYTTAGTPFIEDLAGDPEAGGFYAREAHTDPNGNYTIYVSRSGDYTLVALKPGYTPEIDSYFGSGYNITDPNTSLQAADIMLSSQDKGPKIRVSSYEWDTNPDPQVVENHTMIMVFKDSNNPANIFISRIDEQQAGHFNFDITPAPIVIDGRTYTPDAQAEFLDYHGQSIRKVKIMVSAADETGTALLPYVFTVNPAPVVTSDQNTVAAATAKNFMAGEGCQSGEAGMADTDGDGEGDTYDTSYVSIPPCGILMTTEEDKIDPDFAGKNLFIKIERLADNGGSGTITARYNVNLVDQDGNSVSDFKVDPEHPLTVCLDFDPNRFEGNLAHLAVSYQGSDGVWKNDGISNIRLKESTICFDINHLTLFTAFCQDIAPSNLTAHALTTNRIDMEWKDCSSNEYLFEIVRSINPDPDDGSRYEWLANVDPNVTAYSDLTCSQDNTYHYRVRALNQFGYTDYSQPAGAATNVCDFPPDAPANLAATPLSGSKIILTWSDNSHCESGFTIVRRHEDEESFTEIATTDPNTTSFADTGLKVENNYYYKVRATGIINDSPVYSDWSNEAVATTLSQSGESEKKGLDHWYKCFIYFKQAKGLIVP